MTRFVCTLSAKVAAPTIMSNYFSKRRGNDIRAVAKIWEVARATSAASSFFEPIVIGGETFLDGATPANNPVNQLWSEAADIFRKGSYADWSLAHNIRCLVSIGTGELLPQAFGPSVVSVGKALLTIATETRETAETFHTHHSFLFQDKRAFRFNVGSGLEKVGLEEKDKIEDIRAATRSYLRLEDTHLRMQACIEKLEERTSMLVEEQLL
jgi:predicted acylesterase/phospholipase RssA